jgi:exopolyphosphatase/pppGpp-phosphohydrolase
VVMAKYKTDEAHAKHVASLAERLFENLKPVHRLVPEDAQELHLAALLHDIGHFVGEKKHHMHSCYLILTDDLLKDWDEGIRSRVAYAALNHRKKKRLDWEGLPVDEPYKRDAITALLRIADMLDYEHGQKVVISGSRFIKEERLVVLEFLGMGLAGYEKKLMKKLRWAADFWGVDFVLDNGKERMAVLRG